MIKNNKLKAVISSIIILLPMLFGIIMWNELPDIITTHFGADGKADGFSGKAFAVFGIPVIFLALHWLSLLITSLDKKQKEQTKKAVGMMFWIIPILSLFVNIVTYSIVLGRDIDLELIMPALLGIAFIVMGNYMPKIKQNSTLGIKISWALHNEENWNKTHRFGGKLMVAGGFIMLLSALLPFEVSIVVFICVLSVLAIAPVIYSYTIYKQHQKQGIDYALKEKSKAEKVDKTIALIVVPIILIAVVIFMFTGNIEVNCGDTALEINADYWTDAEIDYTKIDTVEYRKDFDIGVRTNGLGSARLNLGVFKNDELGSYTLYSYTGATEFVVLSSDGNTLVIGMKNASDTQAIYNTIKEKTM